MPAFAPARSRGVDPFGRPKPSTRSYTDYSTGRPRLAGSIFGTPEEQDRDDFVTQGLREYEADPITQKSKLYSTLGPVFESLKKQELEALYDGKNFRVNFGSGGVGLSDSDRRRQEATMPRAVPRGLEPEDRFDGMRPDQWIAQVLEPMQRARTRLDEERETTRFARGLEEQRQSTRLEDELSERYEPRRAGRKVDLARTFGLPMADVQNDIADANSEREARRLSLPFRAGEIDRDFARRRELALGPAATAAQGRVAAEEARAQGVVGAANARRPDPIELLIDALSAARSGGWGVDRQGRPLGPPPELQQRLRDLLMPGGAAGGGAPQGPQPGPTPQPPGGGGVTSGPVPQNPPVGARHQFEDGVYRWNGVEWDWVG